MIGMIIMRRRTRMTMAMSILIRQFCHHMLRWRVLDRDLNMSALPTSMSDLSWRSSKRSPLSATLLTLSFMTPITSSTWPRRCDSFGSERRLPVSTLGPLRKKSSSSELPSKSPLRSMSSALPDEPGIRANLGGIVTFFSTVLKDSTIQKRIKCLLFCTAI